jgi:hypothetical protein
MFTQYKAWAVPILYSTASNLRTVLRNKSFNSREGREIIREALVIGPAALFVYSYMNEEDDSFVGQMLSKSVREALSAVGAINPVMWARTPRLQQYIEDVVLALEQLVMLETYKTGERKGTLKGDNALYRQFTPAPIRQMGRAIEAEPRRNTGGLPALPELPPLPKLPALPKL